MRIEIMTKHAADFCRIDVDGCLLSSQTENKCDYVFAKIGTENRFLFVELKKTGDLSHAVTQIFRTIEYFDRKLSLRREQKCACIVSGGVPRQANQKFQKLQAMFITQYGISLRKDTRQARIDDDWFCKAK